MVPDGDGGGSGGSKSVTLVSHNSWAAEDSTPLREDPGTSPGSETAERGAAVNKAVLTKDNPQARLPRATTPLAGPGPTASSLRRRLDRVDAAYRTDTDHRVTPVDTGDICVNYDKAYFSEHKLTPPDSFDDLIEPEYKDLLVTENAAGSSPGLGFLLGTAAEYGDDGWQDYWKKLKANGVKVVDSWEQAYNEEFSGSSGGKKAKGDRPLVVSYASSPPAEVIYADPQPATAPTGVAQGTCFRQVEYAGLLSNARNPEGGKALLDFMLSKQFQEDLPLNMFVYPVREDAAIPEAFRKFGPPAEKPRTMDPAKIADNRDQWVKSWTSLVVR
nr:thiamine ABC transporter substrate-binding protein [Streptomyces sp. DHE17-7]